MADSSSQADADNYRAGKASGSGPVPADLTVPLTHGGAVQEAGPFQNGIFPKAFFQLQNSILKVFLLLQAMLIREQAELKKFGLF